MDHRDDGGDKEPCVEPYAQGTVVAAKYTLERLIGSGASGSVWMASHPAMGLALAIKIVHAHPHPDGIRLLLSERLAREARAAARIRHPAVVRVFDLGMTSRGDPFIAMELLHGETLRRRLQREHKLTAEAAVALLLPIAAGLDAVHARGVVHRDIKPDNIVIEVDDSGRCHPKLLDFGVAKLSWLQPGGGRLTGDAIVGTPEYMAPEQALGLQGTDHKVDIWSLTLVLYELVAGRVPFPGQSFEEVLRPIVQDPPPPIPGIDPQLWQILQRGLQKSPADRYPSMHALGASLALWLEGRGLIEDISGVSLGQWLGVESVLKDARASRPPPAGRARRRMHLAYAASLLSGASMAWFLLLAGIGDARSLLRASNAPEPASTARAPMPAPPPADPAVAARRQPGLAVANRGPELTPSEGPQLRASGSVARVGEEAARRSARPHPVAALPRIQPVLPVTLRNGARGDGPVSTSSGEPSAEPAPTQEQQRQQGEPTPNGGEAPETGTTPRADDNPYYD